MPGVIVCDRTVDTGVSRRSNDNNSAAVCFNCTGNACQQSSIQIKYNFHYLEGNEIY